MNDPEPTAEESDFDDKKEFKEFEDLCYFFRKERDAYWKQVQQLRAEVDRLNKLLKEQNGS